MSKYILMLFCFFSFGVIAEPYYIKFESTQVYEEGDRTITEKDYGSGVRWNSDYVVTAKHVDFAKNSVYKCSRNCDLQFIKMPLKGKGVIPEWRERTPYEKVIMIGNSIGGKTVVTYGQDLKQHFYVDGDAVADHQSRLNESNAMVYASNAKVVEGQSGGPVFGEDGKVLGIIIGRTVLTSKSGEKFNSSVYIPYSVIKNEWEKFKGK